MVCPFCGKEMQRGILAGDGRANVTWKPGEKKTGAFDQFLGINKITAAEYTLAGFTIEADCCGFCKKMIFDTDIQNHIV